MNESEIELYGKRQFFKEGWITRKVRWVGHNAAPDRIFAKEGVVVFVEFKAPGKSARLNQEIEIAELRKAGLTVLEIDSKEKVDAFLRGNA